MPKPMPVLDIAYISEKYDNSQEWKSVEFTNDEKIKILVNELSTNFGEWGFLYVKGHTISKELIEKAFVESESFFQFPHHEKIKYKRGNGINVGFVPENGEIFDREKPADIKQAFDFAPHTQLCKQLADQHEMKNLKTLFNECTKLVYKLLRLLALALGVDMEHFINLHSHIGEHDKNGTTMRMLYYPSIHCQVKQEQTRCTEHTDYGTMTLLFQDRIGGLEVFSPNGEFVKATPINGAIVINAADLLSTWSNGKFPATIHRVTIPTEHSRKEKARQSIAFFTHPDYTVDIDYIGANGEKLQRNAYEHLKRRFDTTITANNY